MTRLRQRGRRSAATFASDFGPQARRCRDLPCSACVWTRRPQRTTTEPHHEPPRSLGGTDRHTLPLCQDHHRQRHQLGAAAFWGGLELDPETILAAVRLGTPTPGDPYDAVPY